MGGVIFSLGVGGISDFEFFFFIVLEVEVVLDVVFDVDLLKKIEYYLGNDKERIDIVKRGMLKVLQNYTVKAGAQKILDILFDRFRNYSYTMQRTNI